MKLDRLKALIRLANNNPNDNEANRAARKVCIVLAEDSFALLNHRPVARTAADKMNEHRQNYQSGTWSGFEGTWNDVKRSKESEFRSKPPTGPPPPRNDDFTSKSYDDLNDFFKKYTKEYFYGGGRGGGKSWTDSAPHVDAPEDNSYDRETNFKGPNYSNNNNYYYDKVTGQRIPKRQEMRKCSKCGLEIPTYRINEDPWICNPCHWKDAP